jgi:hypothetical protein
MNAIILEPWMESAMRLEVTTRIGVVLTLTICALVPLSNTASARNHGRTNAAIGGFIAGTAITSALSPRKVVVYPDIYGPAWGPPPYPTDSFRPAAGIICYSSQRACYTAGGGYNPKWTWNIFAR